MLISVNNISRDGRSSAPNASDDSLRTGAESNQSVVWNQV